MKAYRVRLKQRIIPGFWEPCLYAVTVKAAVSPDQASSVVEWLMQYGKDVPVVKDILRLVSKARMYVTVDEIV